MLFLFNLAHSKWIKLYDLYGNVDTHCICFVFVHLGFCAINYNQPWQALRFHSNTLIAKCICLKRITKTRINRQHIIRLGEFDTLYTILHLACRRQSRLESFAYRWDTEQSGCLTYLALAQHQQQTHLCDANYSVMLSRHILSSEWHRQPLRMYPKWCDVYVCFCLMP